MHYANSSIGPGRAYCTKKEAMAFYKSWEDIPDQTDKVAVITGANSGLGYETALALARKNATVVMAVRTQTKGNAASDKIKAVHPNASVDVMILDLSSLDSIGKFASAYLQRYDRLDMLINNAGMMATPQSQTSDGFELQIGVNHLGHFALTGMLIDLLDKTPDSRVVNVSSLAANSGEMNFDDLMSGENYSRFGAYAQSKLANLVFTNGLQQWAERNSKDVMSVAAHPGGSKTNLSNGMEVNKLVSGVMSAVFGLMMMQADQGALSQLYAATAADVKAGDYFGPDGFQGMRGLPEKIPMTSKAHDAQSIEKLWQMSEELTGVAYS